MEGKRGKILYLVIVVFGLLIFNFSRAESIIDVPFISQLPPGTSWNITKNCGPTSYLMIDSFYTNKKLSVQSIKDVDDWLNVNYNRPIDNYNGYYTSINDLKKIAINFGNFKNEDVVLKNSLVEVKEALERSFPVIVFVYTNMRYKVDRDQPHFMVLTGISGDTVYTNDPGKTNGKNKAYPLSQFLYAWSLQNNAALIFYPPGHNQNLNPNNSFGSVFDNLFGFVNNIFDIQNIIPATQDVKGDTVVAEPTENNEVVYTASITDKNQNLEVEPGQTISVVVKVKNTGNIIWQKNLISLNVVGGENINKKFYDSSWKTHLRPTLLDGDVVAGETGTFSFKIKIPEQVGNYIFKTVIVRQNSTQFTQVGNEVFVLNLTVKEKIVEDNILPVVTEDTNNSNILDNLKQTVGDIINKVNDVVENIVSNIPKFFGGGSAGSSNNINNTDNTDNTDNNSNPITPEPELFFTITSSTLLTNSATTTISGEKSVELTNFEINNVLTVMSVSGTAWSAGLSLSEGENNLSLAFSNDEQTKFVTGTLQVVLDSISPEKPVLTSVLHTDNNPQLNLNWQSTDSGSGLAYYVLDYKNTTSSDWQNLLENTTSTEFILPVEIGNSYEFRVKAVDKLGNESLWSNDGENQAILVDWSKEVAINEIAYAPTYQGGCGGEWIELYNSQNSDLDLSGWTLEVSDVNSSSTKSLSGVVSSTAYLVVGISIPDTGAKITLKNSLGKIIDETNQEAGWFVDNNFKHVRSLERMNANLSGNLLSNWRENNSLRFPLRQSSCGQDYSSRGFSNSGYYYLDNKLVEDYIFSTSSTDNYILTLTKENNPYILDERVILPANYTLVLEPGVVVVGLNSKSSLEVSGNLVINGTTEEPIYITSARDKTVADWHLSEGNPFPGSWGIIVVYSGGRVEVDYANFLYGGFTYRTGNCFACYAQEVIRNEGGSVILNHSNFDNMLVKKDYNEGNDAYIWNAGYLAVDNSNFNKGYMAIKSKPGTAISISNSTFSNFDFWNSSPLDIRQAILGKWENNIFENNNVNTAVLPTFNITQDYTLTSDYNNIFFDGIHVLPTSTLTILPGVDVNLNAQSWLKVEGSLQAIGTANNHIRFCPKGVCEGLLFQNSQDNVLSFVDVNNAGYQTSFSYPFLERPNYTGAIWLNNSSLSIDNSNIMDNRRPTGFCINSLSSNLSIVDSSLGWNSDYKHYHNWETGGIRLIGGNHLYLNNVDFHFMNYAIYDSQGDGLVLTYDNMSSENFIDMYIVGHYNQNWFPLGLFPFTSH